MRWIAVLAGIALLPACFESKLRYCANGGICPESLACTEHADSVCGEVEEVDACKTIAEGKSCTSARIPVGVCAAGVCTTCDPVNVECRYPEWKTMSSGTEAALRALWVNADDDVYAVGAGGTIVHYDGTAWTKVDGPMRGAAPVTDTFNGVWASGAELFIVAQGGSAYHFNNGWTEIPPILSPLSIPYELFGIWGADPGNVFTVGESGTVARLGGAAWQPMTSGANGVLAAIYGTSAGDIYAVGGAGEIQHYNGASWQDSPQTPIMGVTFNGVWTTASDATVAVGTQNATAQIYERSSAGWNNKSGAPARALDGVWGRAGDDVFAVGSGDNTGAILHFDGTQWMQQPSGTSFELAAVAGTDTNVFAVGLNGTILRYAN